jgi:hypothetical protein
MNSGGQLLIRRSAWKGNSAKLQRFMKRVGTSSAPTSRRDIYACLPSIPILGQLSPYRSGHEVGRVDVYIVVLGVLEDVQSHVALHGCATAGEAARIGRREGHDNVPGHADSAFMDVRT